MRLEELNMVPCTGFEQAESDLLAAFSSLVDLNTPPQSLFGLGGVELGFDAEIRDAILAHPQPDFCPLVRINIWQDNETLAMGGGPVFAPFILSLYFFYYYGVPSTDPLPPNFVRDRRRHLAMCMRAIQFIQPGITEGIPDTSRRYWKWDSSRNRTIDYVSPFRYLNESYVPMNGYNCVRMDCPILIKTAQ